MFFLVACCNLGFFMKVMLDEEMKMRFGDS